MKKLTREWLRKAEADLRLAKTIAREKPPLHDGVCFHCQQSAEKFLKGLLQERGVPVPYTHDLELLLHLAPTDIALRKLRRGLEFLSRFAVAFRYPGLQAKSRQSTASLRWAMRVRAEVRKLLGLRT